ncbi:LytTR family DNA-binding domain-containing protein [Pelagibius sp. Alg239-R121]|uniref:LytTR family DNA-binding domain-containing protein n=1 Tax=Pelagibius sp. Alg239-R121 TaxID=2993448 RepID=UPI0024A62444|nr:LytTR family DNA-binding domain-containing protein [Pelagibius sp. Alg239-R121]
MHERGLQAVWRREETYVIAIAVLAALLIAASEVAPNGVAPIGVTALSGLYAYWLIRLFIETLLFVALRQVIERYLPEPRSFALVTALAIGISLPPFVLAITAFDIVLGYPELGLEAGAAAPASKFTEFGLELLFLSDNHLVLCLLLSLPKIFMARLLPSRAEPPSAREAEAVCEIPSDTVAAAERRAAEPRAAEPHAAEPSTAGPSTAILSRIDPPLSGEILWAEAQEHYVRLKTTEETRMVLHRFSDILLDLPAQAGIQVHRSHWVAFDAIAEPFKDGANLRLRLQSGEVVPVSRSYRSATEQALAGNVG